TIEQETQYPFDGTVTFTLKLTKAAKFPLYFRIPGWCDRATQITSGWKGDVSSKGKYLRIEDTWKNGQKVTLRFAMPVRVKTWKAQHNNVSIYRGPLAFSIRIEERASKLDAKEKNHHLAGSLAVEGFDVWEILPGSPWNYGLVLDKDSP